MARGNPLLLPLHQLEPGQHADCFVLLAERKRATTREGKPFFPCRFRDARRAVTVMVWSDSPFFADCEADWQEGQFYKVRGTYVHHERYGPQFELEQIRPIQEGDREAGFDPAQFVEHSRFDAEVLFAEVRGLVEQHVADQPLRRLVLALLDRHAAALKRLPASLGKYYPFAAGLLEHTLSVARNCLWLADRYAVYYSELRPPLNRDLIVAAAVLHEVGRVLELEGDPSHQPTVAGRLSGHILLARDLIRDAAREQGDLNPDLVQLLEHVVLTHLSLPEWGSPRLPLVPEALILHHADDLDAKLEMYVRCLTRDQSPGLFTERDPVLGRHLLKARTV